MDNLGVLLYVPYRILEIRVHEALAAAGYEDITPAQGRVFANVSPQGSRLTDLAARAQVAKQTASALVDQLEHSGYVKRVSDPTDGRARLIKVAERGAASVPIVRRVIAEVEQEWAERIGVVKMRRLKQLLIELRGASSS